MNVSAQDGRDSQSIDGKAATGTAVNFTATPGAAGYRGASAGSRRWQQVSFSRPDQRSQRQRIPSAAVGTKRQRPRATTRILIRRSLRQRSVDGFHDRPTSGAAVDGSCPSPTLGCEDVTADDLSTIDAVASSACLAPTIRTAVAAPSDTAIVTAAAGTRRRGPNRGCVRAVAITLRRRSGAT
jgi:hypothetical protein